MKKAIKDLRTINRISKKYKLIFDEEHKYIISDYSIYTERELKKQGYFITYISGCFYPYLTKEIQ